MKKPDRFEREVDKLLERDGTIYHHEVTDLLRKEHAWVRRQLRAISKVQFEEGPFNAGVVTVIEEMVYRLDQRRK